MRTITSDLITNNLWVRESRYIFFLFKKLVPDWLKNLFKVMQGTTRHNVLSILLYWPFKVFQGPYSLTILKQNSLRKAIPITSPWFFLVLRCKLMATFSFYITPLAYSVPFTSIYLLLNHCIPTFWGFGRC